jgi:hypothetical protein
VIERNPTAILNPEPIPGYVWLATPGKVLHVLAGDVAFLDEPP